MLSQAQSTAAAADAFDPEGSFYLAVHRRELGKRWFMSAYLKQFFPDAVLAGAASIAGHPRRVSFKIQNGKLFVFDVDDRKQTSDTFGQDVIVDAYPMVDRGARSAARQALKDYVLVDPAAGLNRFGVVGDALRLGLPGPVDRFTVELAFSQHFRQLEDGATFEQAFTGYTEAAARQPGRGGVRTTSAPRACWGWPCAATARARASPRRPCRRVPHLLSVDPRLVPNTGDAEQLAAKWNIRPGMKPIRWLISPLVKKAAADTRRLRRWASTWSAAVKAGIESWNEAFGFPVLEAELAAAGRFVRRRRQELLHLGRESRPSATPSPTGACNPNSGEIRGASVYFNDAFVDGALRRLRDPTAGAARQRSRRRPPPGAKRPVLTWEPFPRQAAVQPAALAAGQAAQATAARRWPAAPPRKEQVEKAIAVDRGARDRPHPGPAPQLQGLAAAAVQLGDGLQLRRADRRPRPIPGTYDVAAIRYLYGLSAAPARAAVLHRRAHRR